MGVNEFLHKIKQNKENIKPENYKAKFKPGDIIFNAKYNVLSKVQYIKMYLVNNSKPEQQKHGIHDGLRLPHYVMLDIHNNNYLHSTKETKPKKRVRIAQPGDMYYGEASEAQKILFGKVVGDTNEHN